MSRVVEAGVHPCGPAGVFPALLLETLCVTALVLVAVSVAGALWRRRLRLPDGWGRPAWMALLLVLVCALPVALYVARGTAVYFDEYHHGAITESIASGHLPYSCCRYEDGQCVRGGPLLWPVSTHVIAAALEPFFPEPGSGLAARRMVNLFFTLVAPVLAWAWLTLLTGRSGPAFGAAVAWGLFPPRLKLAFSGALMPGTVFLLLALLLGVELVRRYPRSLAGIVAAGALLALTLLGRIEMFLVVPWCLWRLADAFRVGGPVRVLVLGASLPLLSLASLVLLVALGVRASTAGWGPGLRELVDTFIAHVPGNIMFLPAPAAGAPLLVLAALLGAFLPGAGIARMAGVTALVLLAFYSMYFIGVFEPRETFDGWRYSIPVALFLAPAATLGLDLAWRGSVGSRALSAGVLAVLLGVQFLPQRAFLEKPHPLRILDDAISRWALDRRNAGEAPDLLLSAQPPHIHDLTGLDSGILDLGAAELKAGRRVAYLREPFQPPKKPPEGLCLRPLEDTDWVQDRRGPMLFDVLLCATNSGVEQKDGH